MIKHWIIAIRPKTLPASIAPVVIGLSMAFGDGDFHLIPGIVCLITALLIQIGTNLANDYFDFKKGADANRIGPTRVTQAGLIKPQTVLNVTILIFFIAALFCIYLVRIGGPTIAVIAVAAIVSGFLYTAGRRPIGYLGLGELFVFIFFGPVAVAGTYYIQTFDINWAVILAGFGPGFLSCAILAINNLRDIEGDRKAGKYTLAVRFGEHFAYNEFLFCILLSAMSPFFVHFVTRDHQGVLFASLVGIFAIDLVRRVMQSKDPIVFNKALASTGQLLIIFSAIFSIGWILCSR